MTGADWIRATSDAEDRLVAAEEPLAGLQLRCGGELPGTIAVPALLETVRKARRYQLKLARTFNAQDGESAVTATLTAIPIRSARSTLRTAGSTCITRRVILPRSAG